MFCLGKQRAYCCCLNCKNKQFYNTKWKGQTELRHKSMTRKNRLLCCYFFLSVLLFFSPLFTFHCFAACFVFFLSRFITSRHYKLLVAVYSCFSCFPSRSSFIVYFFSRLFSFHFTYRLLVHFDMACLTYARETRALYCYFPWQCHFQS